MTLHHDLWLDVPTLEPDDRLVARVVELTAVSRARAHPGGGFVMTWHPAVDRAAGPYVPAPRNAATRRRCVET